MPHIIIKMYPGRTEQEKRELTRKIVEDVVALASCKEKAVSVTLEEVEPDDWAETVYRPDILKGRGTLYKKPGYDPFSSPRDQTEEKPDLMTRVRKAARIAEQEDNTAFFNPMSWLDKTLEDNPEFFNAFFDTPWHGLSDSEKQARATAIRQVL